jgi:phenylacetate-CoA ligase
MGEIFGRSQDFIWSKKKQKVWLTALIFGQHFEAFKNIIKWQLRQDALGAVAIKIVRGYDYGSKDEREIIEKFQSSADILVTFEYVDAIPTTKAGKHLFLLQNVKI